MPKSIYLFTVKGKNGGKRCEICSKLTIKTSLTSFCGLYFKLKLISPFLYVSVVDFEQVNIS